MIFITGCVIQDYFVIYYVELGCPIVAAGGPGRWLRHCPADLGEFSTILTFPDGEVVAVPTHCCDCIIRILIVEHSRVRRISLALNWIDVSTDYGK